MKRKKTIKIVFLVIFIIFFFVGIWYPETFFIFTCISDKKEHFDTFNPPEIINNSPENFLSPFSIRYNAPQTLTFLINYEHNSFHIFYIEFYFEEKYYKHEINKDFIINYNKDVFSNELWSFGGYYRNSIPKVNFQKLFSNIGVKKEFELNTKIVYNFDNEEIEYQSINYMVEKILMVKHFSPFSKILNIFYFQYFYNNKRN